MLATFCSGGAIVGQAVKLIVGEPLVRVKAAYDAMGSEYLLWRLLPPPES